MSTRMTYQQLIAYAAEELSGSQALEVEAHLVCDPAAAETVARYRAAFTAMQGDDGVEPSPPSVARAKGIFDPRHFASNEPGLAETVVGAIARLIFDSRTLPAPVGLRGQATGFQRTYELSESPVAELDLHGAIDDDNGWRLVGQLASRDPIGAVRVELCRPAGATPIQTVDADERGTFVLHVAPGTYDLRLRTSAGVTVVRDLRMA